MMPFAGLWVNVGIVMSANNAMVDTPLPSAPSQPTRGLSAPGPSIHLGENAVGVNNKVALQVAAPSCVNSVSSSLTVPCSTLGSLVLIPSRRLDYPEFLVLLIVHARLHWLCH